MLRAERDFIEKRVQKIIELKKVMCAGNKKGFVVVNQKVLLFNTTLFESGCLKLNLFTGHRPLLSGPLGQGRHHGPEESKEA